MSSKKQRRGLMAEINVVPYIDVMLVLLVIFMVTAPLMNQGIEVDLPDAHSGSLDMGMEEQPLVISIRADGSLLMNVGNAAEVVPLSDIASRTTKILAANPDIRVLVEGDRRIAYGKVIELMDVLEQAGADSIGLITELPEN